MPPIPRKSGVPRAARKVVPPITGKDDITKWEDDQPILTIARETGDDDYFPGDEETDPAVQVKLETPPKIPSPIAVRTRELANRAKALAKAKPTRTRSIKPRVSVDKLIGGAWQMFAQLAAPINLPVARVLDMQAPVAGMLLEDTIKNTVIDRVLQPIARLESGGEVAFALMGPPLLVAAITQRPQAAPILVPLLRQSLMSWIEIAGPKLEEVAKKEQKFQEQYGQRIDEMITYFIGEPETSPNGAHPSNTSQRDTTATGTATN